MVTESNKRLKTKGIIQEAMVRLLQTESFDDISTVQLAKEAGISRSSFYTHYFRVSNQGTPICCPSDRKWNERNPDLLAPQATGLAC